MQNKLNIFLIVFLSMLTGSYYSKFRGYADLDNQFIDKLKTTNLPKKVSEKLFCALQCRTKKKLTKQAFFVGGLKNTH
jgi:hypothetical protein